MGICVRDECFVRGIQPHLQDHTAKCSIASVSLPMKLFTSRLLLDLALTMSIDPTNQGPMVEIVIKVEKVMLLHLDI